MPLIARFYGIGIYMFHRDHAPPHFHAIYGDHEAAIEIETLATQEGKLPRNARNLVLDWARLHQVELRTNWALATAKLPLNDIEPLD